MKGVFVPGWFLSVVDPGAGQVYWVLHVEVVLEVVGTIAFYVPEAVGVVGVLHKQFLDLVHLFLEVVEFWILYIWGRLDFFFLWLLNVVLLDVDNLVYFILFAVLLEIPIVSGFYALGIEKTTIVSVVPLKACDISQLCTFFDFLEMGRNHMLFQRFVMVLRAFKSIVELIYTYWAFVQFVLPNDEVILVSHHAKQVEIHLARFQTLHEILVV